MNSSANTQDQTAQLAKKITASLARATHSERRLGIDVDGLDCSIALGVEKTYSFVICADGSANKVRIEAMAEFFGDVCEDAIRLAVFEDDDCEDGVQTMLWLDIDAAGRILGAC